MRDCCKVNKYAKKCVRTKDKKIFLLPRKFSRKKCLNSKIRGFTMKASCSPYKFCKKTYKGGKEKNKRLPILRKIVKSNKKYTYKLYDPQYKRILAIEEGINEKKNKTKKDKQKAAQMKKARFNILRLYRKNNDKKGCKNLTKDMIYISKKYNLGKTKNICGGSKKKKKLEFLYNPNDPKKSFDVYIDKNPNDTIPIKYKTVEDVKHTIKKLERLYKSGKYSHKRIWQVGMIMYVRLKVLKNKKPKEYNLSKKYFKFLGNRTKLKTDKERKDLKFNT